jgi:Carboxypeptidase regulatory-like domain
MSANKISHFYISFIAGLAILLISIPAISQSGGPYVIQQSVVAGGGTTDAAGGQFSFGGTIGQAVAGQRVNSPASSAHAGFWNPDQLGPSAAGVSIGGRVTSAAGQGIRNVSVTLNQNNGTTRTCLTGSFGYYQFDDVQAGQSVIITVKAKRYTFAQPAITISVADVVSDADFVSIE